MNRIKHMITVCTLCRHKIMNRKLSLELIAKLRAAMDKTDGLPAFNLKISCAVCYQQCATAYRALNAGWFSSVTSSKKLRTSARAKVTTIPSLSRDGAIQ